MSGLFQKRGSQNKEAIKPEQVTSSQAEAYNRYDGMVTQALERLTRWAFPDSQIERPTLNKWQLWHTTDDGKKYVDVSVELQFSKGQPKSFFVDGSLQTVVAKLNREDLDDALRQSICSLSPNSD